MAVATGQKLKTIAVMLSFLEEGNVLEPALSYFSSEFRGVIYVLYTRFEIHLLKTFLLIRSKEDCSHTVTSLK